MPSYSKEIEFRFTSELIEDWVDLAVDRIVLVYVIIGFLTSVFQSAATTTCEVEPLLRAMTTS